MKCIFKKVLMTQYCVSLSIASLGATCHGRTLFCMSVRLHFYRLPYNGTALRADASCCVLQEPCGDHSINDFQNFTVSISPPSILNELRLRGGNGILSHRKWFSVVILSPRRNIHKHFGNDFNAELPEGLVKAIQCSRLALFHAYQEISGS